MGNSEWAALLAMCTAVSFSPGPNTTLSTALAANHGLRRALRFCLAVPVGWALLLVLCGAGLGTADESRLNLGFWQGVGLQFLNIKAWMLAITLTGGWVIHANGQAATNPTERLVQVVGVGMAFAFCSNFTYACIGSVLRQWLEKGHRLIWFNRGMALLLVITAGWILRA